MKRSIDEIKKIVKEYLLEKYNNLYIKIENNFIGCKVDEKDYFIFFISNSNGELVLTYREDYKEKDVLRINIEYFNDIQLKNYIDRIMNNNIVRKSSGQPLYDSFIIEEPKSKYNNKKKLSDIFGKKEEKPDVRTELENNILSPTNQLSIEKTDIDHIKNFTDEEYEKYVDFGIKVGEIINDFLMDKTTDRTAEIFKYRYCFNNSDNYTLQKIGDMYNLSRERIRQILLKVDRKLKYSMNRKIYLNPIISLINGIDNKEIIKYYIYGIINVYNKHFLKLILDLIDKDYSNHVFEYIDEIAKKLRSEVIIEKQNDKIVEKSIELVNLIKFPERVVNYTNSFSNLHKEREVNPENNIGTVHLTNQNKDVDYESFSEKKILELLSNCPNILDIKVQSLVIKYVVNSNEYSYYPDFQILFKDGRMAIVEVKSFTKMGDYIEKNKYNALREYCEKNGIGYMMIDEKMMDYETARNIKYDEEKKKSLIDYFTTHNVMRYDDFKEFKNEVNLSGVEFLSMIINDDNIIFSRFPFYIRYKKH